MRLRAPFDPLPYSALIAAAEEFFEHLVQVRQSSLYFHPDLLANDDKAAARLAVPRRDAVAVILMDLYVLAAALRADKPVPRYVPSAAIARKRLLDVMDDVEGERAERLEAGGEGKGKELGFGVEVDGKGSGVGLERKGSGVGVEEKGKGGEKAGEEGQGRRWADVYQYAYSSALTDIVGNLQEMQRYTKEVCGEVSWEREVLIE